jgi:hypothetical protein
LHDFVQEKTAEAIVQMKNDYESQLLQKDVEIRRLQSVINVVQQAVGTDQTNHVLMAGVPSYPGDKNSSLIENLPKYEKDIMLALLKHPNIPFTRSQLALKAGKSELHKLILRRRHSEAP